MLVRLRLQRRGLIAVAVAPHRTPTQEHALLRSESVDQRLLLAAKRILQRVVGNAQAAVVSSVLTQSQFAILVDGLLRICRVFHRELVVLVD